MRRLGEEMRAAGQLFVSNPAMIFVALLVFGMAVSSNVAKCSASEVLMNHGLRVARVMHLSRAGAMWRGDRVDRAILRTLAYPRPLKRAKGPEKPADRHLPSKSAGPQAQTTSAGCLSDLRFPEFNLLIPPL